MRRTGTGLAGLAVLLALVLTAGSASADGPRKLVEGTVYDTTCAVACTPCPPPCGPIPAPQSRADIVCARGQERMIVCPLVTPTPPPQCVRAEGCPPYGTYSGEGAVVNVRRRGSKTPLATVPVLEGHFKIRLGAGEYVLHPYLPEEPCWSGGPVRMKVTPRLKSPVAAAVYVADGCVAHPDVR
ncbi:MAG TPA: hypothetical protein VHE08_06205 [Solirubrobacterales bacterium]|nr:hypothetical protein [Solirubrobacterales bacterium]